MTPLLRFAPRLAAGVLLRRPPGTGVSTRPEDHGLDVDEAVCRARIEGVLAAFFTGMESACRGAGWRSMAPPEGLAALFHPFYWEGTAMGETMRRRLTWRRHPAFGDGAFSREEPFAFLRVVGVGFARSVLRPRAAAVVSRTAAGFGNHALLVHDGFGFGTGFFHWRGDPAATLRPFGAFAARERAAALNGLGRSLWFRFMDRPGDGIEAARGSGAEDAPALLGGMGLAAAFTFPDDLARGYGIADTLEGDERRAFVKGVRIALFVRDRDQRAFLEEILAAQPAELRARAASDLAVSRAAHDATHADAQYIHHFHEHCLTAGD